MEYRIEIEEYGAQKIIHTYMTWSISEEDRNKVGIETFHKMRENNIAKVIWDIREAELHYSLISVHLTEVFTTCSSFPPQLPIH